MAFDECAEPYERAYSERAMARTHAWVKRCIEAKTRDDQALFGIVQGGIFPDLRQQSAEFIASLDLPGNAIGGLSVGETKEEMHQIHKAAFTSTGRMNISKATYARDERPIEQGCTCYTCQHFSRAYLRHLIVAKELLAGTLLSIHNLHTLLKLARDMRQAILGGRFNNFADQFLTERGNG
jgi:queuine tRNA-ribosyltransferase